MGARLCFELHRKESKWMHACVHMIFSGGWGKERAMYCLFFCSESPSSEAAIYNETFNETYNETRDLIKTFA